MADIAEKITGSHWDHSEGDDRVEFLCLNNPELGSVIEKLALRFISEKGLSAEFADLAEEIERRGLSLSDPDDAPGPM